MSNRTRRPAATLLDVTYRTTDGQMCHGTATARSNGYAITPADVAPDCAVIVSVAPVRSAETDARNAAHAAAIDAARTGR